MKRILNYILIVLAVAGISFLAYRFFTKINAPEVNLIDVVPESAAVVISINQPFPLWNKLNTSNVVWDDLKHSSVFKPIHRTGTLIDSLAKNNLEFASLVYNKPLIISTHFSGSKIDLLYAIPQGDLDEEKIISILSNCFNNKKSLTSRVFKEHTIYTINSNHFILIEKGFLTIATSAQLSESVAMHLEENRSIRNANGFTILENTIAKKADATIIINHSNFPSLLALLLNKETEQVMNQTNPYSLFTGLDVDFSSGTIALNGFSITNDSLAFLIDVFKQHQPQEFKASDILPENTSGFIWLGINDGLQFSTSIENYHQQKGTLNAYRENINQFNSEYDCNIRQHILSWLGNEIVLFTTSTPKDENLEDHLFLALQVNDLSNPTDELNILSAKIDSNNVVPLELFGGIEIRRINHENLFGILFGNLYNGIKNPYFIRIDDYIVFANSIVSLENYLKDLSEDRILGKNITYFNFVSENLNSKSNLTVYANPSLIASQYKSFLNENEINSFSRKEELLNKFNAFAWQMSSNEKGMFYNNIYLKYNSSGKQDSKSLWELSLDTTVSSKVFIVHNHISNTEDIVVQDDNYMLYLISNKGNVIWKKQLDEKIFGEIRQIDYFGNGKLQLAFCTNTQLHLVDLKGNYMEHFPIDLKNDVSAQAGIFDYESNQNYRFLIPIGKQLLNLDKEGKATEGWDFEGASAVISQSPMFFRADNKDYIFVVDELGSIYILDRKGKTRHAVSFNLKNRTANHVQLRPSSTIENTKIIYSDSSGNIIRYFIGGSIDTAKINRLSINHYFILGDLNKDNEDDILTLDSNKLKIREWNGKTLGEYDFSENMAREISIFKGKDGSLKIGLYTLNSGELYVINQDGRLHPKFPLNGTTSFMIKDINGDGSLELVSGISGRRIICYSFN